MFPTNLKEWKLFFRDHELSDLIGFVYSRKIILKRGGFRFIRPLRGPLRRHRGEKRESKTCGLSNSGW